MSKVMLDIVDCALEELGYDLSDDEVLNLVKVIKEDIDNGNEDSEEIINVFNGGEPDDFEKFKNDISGYILDESEIDDEEREATDDEIIEVAKYIKNKVNDFPLDPKKLVAVARLKANSTFREDIYNAYVAIKSKKAKSIKSSIDYLEESLEFLIIPKKLDLKGINLDESELSDDEKNEEIEKVSKNILKYAKKFKIEKFTDKDEAKKLAEELYNECRVNEDKYSKYIRDIYYGLALGEKLTVNLFNKLLSILNTDESAEDDMIIKVAGSSFPMKNLLKSDKSISKRIKEILKDEKGTVDIDFFGNTVYPMLHEDFPEYFNDIFSGILEEIGRPLTVKELKVISKNIDKLENDDDLWEQKDISKYILDNYDESALSKIKREYELESNFDDLVLDVLENNKRLKKEFRDRGRRREGIFSYVREDLVKGKRLSENEKKAVDMALSGEDFNKKDFENAVFKYIPKNLIDEEDDSVETNKDAILYRFDGILHPSKIYGLFHFKEGKPFAFVPGINEEVELDLIDEDGVSLLVVPMSSADKLKLDLHNLFMDIYKNTLDYINYSNFKVHHWGSDRMYRTDESAIDEGKKLDKERQEEYDFAVEEHRKAKDSINGLIEIIFNYSKDYRKHKNTFKSAKENLDSLLDIVRDCLFENE